MPKFSNKYTAKFKTFCSYAWRGPKASYKQISDFCDIQEVPFVLKHFYSATTALMYPFVIGLACVLSPFSYFGNDSRGASLKKMFQTIRKTIDKYNPQESVAAR